MADAPQGWLARLRKALVRRVVVRALEDDPTLVDLLLGLPRVHGDRDRLHIAPTAVVNDALLNTSGGHIRVGPHAFFGHGVAILTGTHDVRELGRARQLAFPTEGRDVVIGEGAWLASRATVLGPCTVGPHAVVAAGAVVRDDVPPHAIVAGVPARQVGEVDRSSGHVRIDPDEAGEARS